ncbi:dTDP-4-dehydrorhamnose 3,5-epimerase family protein [Nonomuraea sp. NPDC050783]|uniref:dTDP-4-dehydrorhamnose 3,5-epimerase family protein n=1 Tax=Nonomuraea sp. NPDC050783 TaxID=3154634 RepID=UPI003467C5AF
MRYRPWLERSPCAMIRLMEPLGLNGAWLFTPRIHGDRRGAFLEWFRNDGLAHPMDVAQANCSISVKGTLRGVHFADVPPGQAKYVTCVAGRVLDVVVDVRTGSPTFGRSVAVELDDRERRAVYLAEGLGHGFFVLSESATVIYLCSTPYAPRREHGVHPLDPALGIAWPAGIEPVLSDKDAAAPTLTEAAGQGLLPSYADCLARYEAPGGQQLRPGRR